MGLGMSGARGAVLEQFEIAGPGAQHDALCGRILHIDDVVHHRLAVPGKALVHRLEAEGLAVERHHLVHVAAVHADVVNASDHARLAPDHRASVRIDPLGVGDPRRKILGFGPAAIDDDRLAVDHHRMVRTEEGDHRWRRPPPRPAADRAWSRR